MKFYYPAKRIYSTSCNFQCHYKWPNNNNGIDWRFPIGTPVLAPADGTVVMSEFGVGANDGYGNFIKIRHGATAYFTLYGHLKKRLVKVGDTVKTGDVIAKSGNTGTPRPGAHLHFEVMKINKRVDPDKYLYKPYKTPPQNGGNGGNGNVPDPVMGIDISHHNAGVDLDLAHEMGIRYAFMKLTEGTYFVDDMFPKYWKKAKSLGWSVSPYHYWKAEEPGKAQVDYFIDAMRNHNVVDEIDFPAVIDAEDPLAPNYTAGNNARNIYDFAKGLQGLGGWPEGSIYTSASWWNNNVNTKWGWELMYLIVAHWGAGGDPAIPQPWLGKKVPYLIHQYGTIKIGGKEIDGDKWNTAAYDFPLDKPGTQPPSTDSFMFYLDDITIGDKVYRPVPPDVTYYLKET